MLYCNKNISILLNYYGSLWQKSIFLLRTSSSSYSTITITSTITTSSSYSTNTTNNTPSVTKIVFFLRQIFLHTTHKPSLLHTLRIVYIYL